MMRRILTLLVLVLLLTSPAARADKAEVLGKITDLIEAGEFDEAKRMLDHFLGRNPGDPDLERLMDTWRIRKGELGPLFAEEGLEKPENAGRLREILLRIVRATYRGNPEEWAALPHAVPTSVLSELLLPATARGEASSEERREAHRILNPKPKPRAPRPGAVSDMLEAGGDDLIRGLRWAEELELSKALSYARGAFRKSSSVELKAAGASALLSFGDESPRPLLHKWLKSGAPPQAVEALKVLLRHPGKGSTPIRSYWFRIEKGEVVERVKPTLYAMVIEALGNSGEEGAREFLEKRLTEAVVAVDAARALGCLDERESVPALLAFLKSPPEEEDGAAGGGLDFLGGSPEKSAAATAESVRPALVGALALLRVTYDPDPR